MFPKICRCCLAVDNTENIEEYKNECSINILTDCFNITLSQDMAELRLKVCDVCMSRVEDAVRLKAQILQSEIKLREMLISGYLCDTRNTPKIEHDDGELKTDYGTKKEINDDSLQDGDEDNNKVETDPCSQEDMDYKIDGVADGFSEDLSADEEPLSMLKRKLQNPAIKARRSKSNPTQVRRSNLVVLFNNSSVIPFKWRGVYMCFYCGIALPTHEDLASHTRHHGRCTNTHHAITAVRSSDKEIKVDTSKIQCQVCAQSFQSLDALIQHLVDHRLSYDTKVPVNFASYRLSDLSCQDCGDTFKYFKHLVGHRNARHNVESFVCMKCPKTFGKRRDLASHVTSYHKDSYGCVECGASFTSKPRLRVHRDAQHLHSCNICLAKFPSSASKLAHIDKAHSRDLQCKFCSKTWMTKQALLQHAGKCKLRKDLGAQLILDEAEGKKTRIVGTVRKNLANIFNMSTAYPFKFYMNRFRCFYCPRDFHESDDLKAHTLSEHSFCDVKHKSMKLKDLSCAFVKVDIAHLSCKVCFEFQTDLDSLINHLIGEHKVDYDRSVACKLSCYRLVKDSYCCPICEQGQYKFFGNVLKHVNEAHSDNRLICVFCGKGFRSDPNLRSHIARHHSEATAKCTECAAIFANAARLRAHMAKCHGKMAAKCPKCPERFTNSYARQKHLIHTHNVGAVCSYCGKMFIRNSLLHQHISRTHLKEKHVQCSVCHMRFFDNNMLKNHMIRHSGNRNFECGVCAKKFLYRKNLRNHLLTHEKNTHASQKYPETLDTSHL